MIDSTDKRILDELQKNSRITMKDLGKKIHMTGQATAIRVAKLEDSGILEGYTIKVNHEKLGYPIHVMVNVIHTNMQNHQSYILFISSQDNYIIHHYKISGDGCYMIECRFPSTQVLDEFVTELNKYVNYKVTVILNEVKKVGNV